jgi:hypothetical protein
MAGDFGHAKALFQRLHQHFLLDGREIRRQPEPGAASRRIARKPFWLSVSRTSQR